MEFIIVIAIRPHSYKFKHSRISCGFNYGPENGVIDVCCIINKIIGVTKIDQDIGSSGLIFFRSQKSWSYGKSGKNYDPGTNPVQKSLESVLNSVQNVMASAMIYSCHQAMIFFVAAARP